MPPRRQLTPDTPGRPRIAVALATCCLLCSFAAGGCGPKPTTQPADAPAASQPSRAPAAIPQNQDDAADVTKFPGTVHLVQPGDTLYSLSKRYYGHGKYSGKIWAANRNRVSNPNDLPVGMKLIIPP
ncbi:MAG TPA: LysM domain-containing protein [Phycisphaerae bacterium]|nr:LysM domain-containing protein [Phycisphaerae bacterium]